MEEIKVCDIVNKYIIPMSFTTIVRKDKYFEVYREKFKTFYDDVYKNEVIIDKKYRLADLEVLSVIIDYELKMLIIKV